MHCPPKKHTSSLGLLCSFNDIALTWAELAEVSSVTVVRGLGARRDFWPAGLNQEPHGSDQSAAQLVRDKHAVSVTPSQTKVTSLGWGESEDTSGTQRDRLGVVRRSPETRPAARSAAAARAPGALGTRSTISEQTKLRVPGTRLLPGRRGLGHVSLLLGGTCGLLLFSATFIND